MEEELYALVVDGLLSCINDALQHQVRLLELIPEEQVVLREGHCQRVCALGKIGTQHVHAAEHPATATLFLVGNRLFLGLYTEIGIQRTGVLLVFGQIVNSIGGQSVAQGTIRGRRSVLTFYLLKHLR